MPLKLSPTLRKRLFPLVQRWIAGETIDEGIAAAQKTRAAGLVPVINYLGEHYTDNESVARTVLEYQTLISRVAKLSGSISVKPSQVGQLVKESYCKARFKEILEVAKVHKVFVWIDMEHPDYVAQTIELYIRLHAVYPHVGLCIQANLERTTQDLVYLKVNDPTAHIRLVKGAYEGTEKNKSIHGLEKKKRIVEAAKKHINYLFEHFNHFAIASHDGELINYALALDAAVEGNKRHKSFEFQFLHGIRNRLKVQLAKKYVVVDYIPYGSEWPAYSFRRIKEHPSNVFLITHSMLDELIHKK